MRTFKTLIASVAIAIFALIGGYTMNAVAADMNETAFKEFLVKGTPWAVEWQNIGGGFRKGSHKLRFTLTGTTLTGELFDSDRGSADLPLKNVTVTGLCVTFLGGQSPRKYSYCFRGGVLKGSYEGQTRSGSIYTGEAAATPTGGK